MTGELDKEIFHEMYLSAENKAACVAAWRLGHTIFAEVEVLDKHLSSPHDTPNIVVKFTSVSLRDKTKAERA